LAAAASDVCAVELGAIGGRDCFRRAPAWLSGIFAFGQIKYGIWTITAWLLYWRSTAEILGAPNFSFDSISMTIAHIGLAAQGLFLLTYFRPTRLATWAALVWFGVSDFVDYGLGFYPAIPKQLISLEIVQWSTITVTVLLVAVYWVYSLTSNPASGPSRHLVRPADNIKTIEKVNFP
jgi:uncharacterized membrane protein YpjA